MNKLKDFIINDKTLEKYIGGDSKVVIPDGVENIKADAFNKNVVSLTIPEGVEDLRIFFDENLEELVLPDSVKYISESRLRYTKLYKNEENWTVDGALYINNHLVRVKESCSGTFKIREGTKTISEDAFWLCRDITHIDIPKSVSFIHPGSLGNIKISLSDKNDTFKLIDGNLYTKDKKTLVRYTVKDDEKEVIIPNGVERLEKAAFEFAINIEKVVLPDSLTHIGENCFFCCENLKNINLPEGIEVLENGIFYNCNNLQEIVVPKSVKEIKYSALYCKIKKLVIKNSETEFGEIRAEKCEFPLDFCKRKKRIYSCYIPKIVCRDSDDYAHLWINQSGKEWDKWFLVQKFNAEDVLGKIVEILLGNKKVTPKQIKRVNQFVDMYSERLSKEFAEMRIGELLDNNSDAAKKIEKEAEKKKECDDLRNSIFIEKFCAEYHTGTFSDEVENVKNGVAYLNHDFDCSGHVIKTLLQEYMQIWESNKEKFYGEMSSGYNLGTIYNLEKPEVAEKIAKELNPDKLSDFLETLIAGVNYRCFCIPYARFATESSMKNCIKEVIRRKKSTAKNRYWAENLIKSMYYSDTNAAKEYIEKYGNFERYTNMRGMTVQEYRDSYSIPNFGFDVNGLKRYLIDDVELQVKINNDFSLSIYDTSTGKNVRTMPRKSKDGVKVAEEYDFMKKEIKEFYKQRVEYMKKIYITGESISMKLWNETYISNALFKPVVESLIWQDDKGVSFEVVSGKCLDLYGAEYIPFGSVRVAHVVDMKAEEIDGWQKLLLEKGKSLLIEQVWEPIVNIEYISGIKLKYRFKGVEVSRKDRNEFKKIMKSKGVEVKSNSGEAWYNHRLGKYEFDLCRTLIIGNYIEIKYTVDENNDTTMFGELYFTGKNNEGIRELNSAIFELDKMAVKSYIARDDVSKLKDNVLSFFTVAQINKFIDWANGNNSTNCTARLLAYKNNNFEYVDVFDMYVLE